ncbi:MAG TPA: hypothetical protein VL326_34650 [Kofleriaceae bacterium]|nr:hypothetical protein [Kofleriaceae bacterium]
MKKISIALFSIVAMAGVASAQTAKGSASAGATVNAGAAAKAGTGAATGAAGSAAGAAKTGAGAATGAAGSATAQAGAAMEMPKPPAEVKDMVKMAGAHNNCKGTGLGMDMKSEVKFTGSINRKADLDNWWVHESMTGTMGEGKTKATMKMEAYMTWDAKMGKWRMVSVMNDGTQMVGTADFKDGKLEAVSDTTGPMGSGMFKDHGDATDKKAGMHMWGEMSMDKGKTWTKVYDMTCK